jgi:hypothetical protein
MRKQEWKIQVVLIHAERLMIQMRVLVRDAIERIPFRFMSWRDQFSIDRPSVRLESAVKESYSTLGTSKKGIIHQVMTRRQET